MGEYGTGKEIPVTFTASSSTPLGANNGNVTLTMAGKSVTIAATANVVTTYYGKATAEASAGGSAYVSFSSYDAATTTSATTNTANTSNANESNTAYYKAVANTGYVFKGWIKGTGAYSAANVVSTSLTYNTSITYNSESSSSPTETTYKAWFAPMFYYSATATSSNADAGTASATVTNEIQGNPGETSKSTNATFTANPNAVSTFHGWYTSTDYSGTPVSTNNPYTESLTNSSPGSTTTTSLYAWITTTQNLQWADTDVDHTLVLGTTGSSAATVTSGKTITYTSSNTDAITVDPDGTLHTIGLGQSTITASVAGDYTYDSESITREFTVGEKLQATFTPAWGEGTSADIKVGADTSIGLTNIATDATFTISASSTGIISWSRSGNTLTIHGEAAGTVTLTLSQTGNTFLNGNTANYEITVSKYTNTFALDAENRAMQVGDVWTNVVTDTGNDNTQISYSVANVATYDAASNSITAVGEGSTVITFTQAATPDHEGTTKTINVNVSKVTNTLALSLPTQEVDVDGTIALGITGRNSAAAIVATISDTQLSSSVNNGSDVITFDATNNRIIAHNAGTAKVTFSQSATTQYTAYTSETYEITVNKISNSITVTLNGEQRNSMNIARGQQVTIAYSSVSDGAYHTNLTSGSNATATIDGNNITAGSTDGTNIWTITQEETFKFAPATTTVRIKVNSVAEEEGYVLNDPSEYYQGTGEGVAHTYELSGPGETVTYTAWTWWAAIYYHLYVQYSVNGTDWENAQDNQSLTDSEQHFSCTIPDNAKYIRFYFPAGGTSRKLIKDVKVTRKTYVRTTTTTTDLGEMFTDQTASTSFTISYSSTNGGDIEITSNNPRFTVNKSSVAVANNSDNVGNPVTVNVTYIPDPDHLGADEGTIIVGDRYYTQELTFTASAKKYPTTITRGSNTATATTVDGSIANAFAFSGTTTAVPSASSDDDFYYAISHTQTSAVNNGDGVISYNPSTNTVTGLNAGTARLTIYQKKTNLYEATSETFDFTVSKLANNVSMALDATTLNVDGTATVMLTNDDSHGTLSAAFSNVSYVNESQNRDGGLLSFDANAKTLTGVNAGTATVTITQAETYKYVAKSQQFEITVNKLSQTLAWDNPALETAMQIGSTLTGNTASSDAGLTPVTYTSSNTAAITVDANTGVLTAVATGSNITITASQAGNYKYLPTTLTRLFSVFNKQTPAFAPDGHFTGANGRIEYLGTATITVTGVSTGDDFTITNGDNTIIRVERDGETITITALSVGNTTLTLAQAGNEDYIAKSQTYNIEVYMPEGYLALSPTMAPTHEAGTYTRIYLNRTFKVGYNTLVLPFDTDLDELVGSAYDSDEDYWVAQLSAVTLNTQDGYTLYFQKVPNGAIEANQPYVLYLGTQVVNPTWIGSFSVTAASAGSKAATTGYSGYASWVMHANYDPAFDMEGMYGIVNSAGALKLGGSGSTLKAYTAYITPPAGAAHVRLRSAFVDEDGEVTFVEGLLFDDDSFDVDASASSQSSIVVYGLDGRRRQNASKGLNIIRTADGRTMKVLCKE